MTRKQRRAGRLVGLCAAVLVIAVGPVASARAQVPQVGEVWWVKAVTLSLRVGSTEKERKLVTYTPPPGWYVRSHWVDCTGRTGRSSFSVHTVPRDWAWLWAGLEPAWEKQAGSKPAPRRETAFPRCYKVTTPLRVK